MRRTRPASERSPASALLALLVGGLMLGTPHEGRGGAKVCLLETQWLVDGLMEARSPGSGKRKLGATAVLAFGPDAGLDILRNQFCMTIAESPERLLPFCGTLVQENCRRARMFVDEESFAEGLAEWLSVEPDATIEVKGTTIRPKLRRKGGEPLTKIRFKAAYRVCDTSGCARGHVRFQAEGGFLEPAP